MPQKQWTDKEERKYKHIRDSAEERGESEDRAEEIAARTVNKQRAREGKTKTASRTSTEDMSSSKRGGKRSHSGPKGRTKEQLYQEARRKNVEGRSKMNKAELLRAVERKK
ncbi:plasmid stabilization protein [Glycomyces terrestris]|uniref:Plasmid stabilization protein n=1 Tax=Glycomyces terrestris TaxID=2493553 RepID=A0A426V4W2_9ACTN|nr:plasmid stabilization protein [Glycomyces terrestris]RRS01949.1 plasmid stabilization protein [Glycomyces terrestris]